MPQTYFKRFRMEIDLWRLPTPDLPEGYSWVKWDRADLGRHAETKFESFREDLDARVFPCLGTHEGCFRLMQEIASRPGFVPKATWMIVTNGHGGQLVDCATIQGIAVETYGAIQNVAVVPRHRRRGLGRALVLKSLTGFRELGLLHAFLEVTAENTPAVELYRQLGFSLKKTLYKATEEPLEAGVH